MRKEKALISLLQGLVGIVGEEAARNPEYRKRLAEFQTRYDTAMTADIAALAERYKVKLDPVLVARSLTALIDGMWIFGQVFANTNSKGHKLGKKACLFYLHSIFPACF